MSISWKWFFSKKVINSIGLTNLENEWVFLGVHFKIFSETYIARNFDNIVLLIVDKIIHFDDLAHEVPKILQNKLKKSLEVPRINSSKYIFWSKKDLSHSDFIFLNDFYESDFKFLKNLKSMTRK